MNKQKKEINSCFVYFFIGLMIIIAIGAYIYLVIYLSNTFHLHPILCIVLSIILMYFHNHATIKKKK